MKNGLLILLAVFVAIIFFPAATFFTSTADLNGKAPERDIIGCSSPFLNDIRKDENGKYVPVLPGWGKYSYRISTSQDSAQFYFDQGLNLYYSYHLRQALASFKEATRFDKACAMAYWGQALSMGPFYNDPGYKMSRQVPDALQSMKLYAENANEKEKRLMAAMQERYSDDTTNSDRPRLDKNYAAAMLSLMHDYPADHDIAALYIDAVMLQHKWDFWNNDGSAKPWTPELVRLCRAILKDIPVHPAAAHYYIHLTEASRHPELALQNATELKNAMPGVSHMVHMASHLYQRNGLFGEGVEVNEKANAASNTADSLSPATGSGQNSSLHYFAVQSYCAMSAGMFNKAMPVYMRARNRAVEINGSLEKSPYLQFIYMMPVIAAVRMGKWQDVVSFPAVDRRWKYASILEDFARGLAYVRRKNYREARECIDRITANMSDSLLAIRRLPFNKPNQTAIIALNILQAELLGAQGDTTGAINTFATAIFEEDHLVYSEPQDWLIPSRQFLGNYLLRAQNINEAEKVYKEDLMWHPGNGWSLIGLYNCSMAANRSKDAARYRAAYLRAFKDADVIPSASVF